VLFGGANKQTLTEGESVTIEVGGISYDVSLLGVSDSDTIVLKVDDESRTIDEGQSRTISGLEVFVDDVFFLSKETQVSSGQITFGSQELTFDNTDEVSVGTGTDAEDIDNTLVSFTQGSEGTSVLEIAVSAPDDEGDFASSMRAFTDPVFGTIKLAMGTGTPDVEAALAAGEASADVEMFDFDTSGDDTATVRFKAYLEDTAKTIEWAFDSDPDTTGTTLLLQDGDENDIFVVEGVNMTEDDFFIANQDDFSHLFEVTDIDANVGDGNDGTLTVKDVFSGTSYEVNMDETGTDSGVFNGTKVIDGKTYVFWSSDQATDVMAVVWGTGAVAPAGGVDVGTVTTVFPTLVTSLEAELAFLNNITIGQSEAGNTYEILGIEVTLANDTNEITGTSINYTYEDATTGFLHVESATGPSVGILEEEGEDLSGSDVQNIVIVEAGDNADGITISTTSSPDFSDAVASGFLSTSNSDIDIAADRYGTIVKRDTDDQGMVEVYYPDAQVVQAVGVGANPSFSVSGTAGTVKEAVKITSSIAKLADEISSPSTLNRDIILMGGPCANALVATLLEVSTEWKPGEADHCGAPFDGLSTGMVKNVADAFGSGQKALIIAGLTGDDTRALAARVLSQGTADYEA
jgi:hypothetical protein